MNNAYTKERIKLTALYFGIILVIVVMFSFIVIHTQNQQLRKFDGLRVEVQLPGPGRPRISERVRLTQEQIESMNAVINEIKRENLKSIIAFDAVILALASLLSYYLSGKTMEPILATLEKQKRFVSDASHELKTPLTNIKTEAEVLNRSKKAAISDYKEFTANVIDDVDRLDELVTFLLDTARLEHRSQSRKVEEVNIAELTRSTAKKFKERAKQKNVEIFVDFDDTITIQSDSLLLHRLLAILIDNAIKYNKDGGGVYLSVYKKKNVVISIKDTGVGMQETDIPKIFDRFYRASEDRHEKGFGLGLAIAKQLAEQLDIDLTVQSKIDEGTTFSLNFK